MLTVGLKMLVLQHDCGRISDSHGVSTAEALTLFHFESAYPGK